ncbi:unnamed protein product [Calypogeia fissa]
MLAIDRIVQILNVSVGRHAAASASSSYSFSSPPPPSSSSSGAELEGQFPTGYRRKIPNAMLGLWWSCSLLAAILGPSEVLAGGGEIWSSMRFPNQELGLDNWHYYRVELPSVFSLLTISLTRDWAHDGNGSPTVATGPLVCFGFHGPPLPGEPRSSLLEAAINAGASQNASSTGECGWFNETLVVNVTNLEVRSGLLHVGIFSDPTPTRTQSKMIARGQKDRFAIGIQVFWCGTEALGGPKCNLGIGSLPPRVLLKSLYSMNTPLHDDRYFLSSRSSRNHVDKELSTHSYDKLDLKRSTRPESESSDGPGLGLEPEGFKDKDLAGTRNRTQDDLGSKVVRSGWSDWISSSQNCIGLDENQFFRVQIADFLQEIEIKYNCISNVSHGISKCEEFETMIKENRTPLIHLRYGALPGRDTSDFLGEPSTGSLIITEPRRGLWFLAFFNPLVTSRQDENIALTAGDDMCLELKWRARSCGPNLTGDNCQWPVLLLERILSEELESPFDSYYYPATRSQSLDSDSEWFSLESFSNGSASNMSVEQWEFAKFRVPDGAAGASMSIDVKTSLGVDAEIYVRYEGCPSKHNWDFKGTKEDGRRLSELGVDLQALEQDGNGSHMLSASKYQTLSLPVVYPVEGYWCIGVKYLPQETNLQATKLENSLNPRRKGFRQSAVDLIHRGQLYFTKYSENLSFANKPFSSRGKGTSGKPSAGDSSVRGHGNPSSGVGKEMELRLTLHGCPDECSGHGNCQTMYEASRLHYISYCRCDVTHGGFDCTEDLLGAWNEFSQRFLLIFSNAAAILPSVWALRHKAYSEWITFTLSGISSAIYHSCDAGGWCAMSYSTLQFLDFWLSFVAIIMTCLLMAGFYGPTKAMLHIGCSVLTAAVARENATSGWSVLVVVLISSTGLFLGWGLETQKLSSLRHRLSVSSTGGRSAWLQMSQRLVRSFLRQLGDRFRWPYLFLGLAILVSAFISNLMESPETYWMFHSWWHIGMYSSALILLHSIRNVDGVLSRRVDDLEEYQHVQRQDEDGINDSHDALVSELDSFADSRIH